MIPFDKSGECKFMSVNYKLSNIKMSQLSDPIPSYNIIFFSNEDMNGCLPLCCIQELMALCAVFGHIQALLHLNDSY